MKKILAKIVLFISAKMKNLERIRLENSLSAAAKIDGNLITGNGLYLDLSPDQADLKIGDNVIFRNFCSLVVKPGAKIAIGDNVFFNNYCSVNCLQEIFIGENTLFGEGVKLYDHNHIYHYRDNNLKVEREDFKKGSIKIGKNCWIGSNVTILNNVEIGDNVIIGANALIHKAIPSNSIVKLQNNLLIESLNDK